MMKFCSRCKVSKPFDSFSISRAEKDGRKRWCVACVKDHYLKNKERILAGQKEYARKNKLVISERNKRRYWQNLELNKERNRANYQNNKEAAKARATRWAKENREKRLALSRRWYRNNLDKASLFSKAYADQNPLAVKARGHRYRSRKRNNGGTITAADIRRIYGLQRGCCALCSKSIEPYFEIDHIVPVSAGGASVPKNTQLLCLPCNRSKGSRDQMTFMRTRGRLL